MGPISSALHSAPNVAGTLGDGLKLTPSRHSSGDKHPSKWANQLARTMAVAAIWMADPQCEILWSIWLRTDTTISIISIAAPDGKPRFTQGHLRRRNNKEYALFCQRISLADFRF